MFKKKCLKYFVKYDETEVEGRIRNKLLVSQFNFPIPSWNFNFKIQPCFSQQHEWHF